MVQIDDDGVDEAVDAYVASFHREPLQFFGITGPSYAAFLRRCVAENNPDLDAHADLPDGAVA